MYLKAFLFCSVPVIVIGHGTLIWLVTEYFTNVMPPWHLMIPLTIDKTTDQNKEKFSKWRQGAKVWQNWGKYVVDADNLDNKRWWKWSFSWFPSDTSSLSDEFKKINKAWGTKDKSNEIALNRVCKSAYEKDLDKVTETYKKNVWEYCSLGGKELFEEEFLRFKIINTQEQSNSWFWKLRNQEYPSITKEESEFFSDLNNGQTVRDRCEKAYAYKEKVVPLIQLIKYCTILPLN